MFIGRRIDGTIYGTWTVPQPADADHPGMEQLPDGHPEVVAFNAQPAAPPPKSLVEQILSHPEFARLKAELTKA